MLYDLQVGNLVSDKEIIFVKNLDFFQQCGGQRGGVERAGGLNFKLKKPKIMEPCPPGSRQALLRPYLRTDVGTLGLLFQI